MCIRDSHSVWILKSYLIQELCKNGILTLGSHNLNLSHTEEHIDTLLNAYQKIIPELIHLDATNQVESALDGKPIQPVFKVR